MVFSSPVFIFIFLPATLVLYGVSLLTKNIRVSNTVLLLCSMAFYAYGGLKYLLLLLISIAVNYFLGLMIEKDRRRLWLILALVWNIGLIVFFKYLKLPGIVLPIGISFYTFQILSYVIDEYRGDVRCQHDPLQLALYVLLFPQLIAGPIVRYADVQEALTCRTTGLDRVYRGILRFMQGFVKKVLLANVLGNAADLAFALPAGRGMFHSWTGILCYSLQIYLDFSAYSDMAIGLGQIFGFDFPENFNYPYISRSIKEFWRRWHMSLSTWFRDYVYIPLGGSREGEARTRRNLMIVFVLTGIWHGADVSFLLWGLYYGVLLILERGKAGKLLDRLSGGLRLALTLFLVILGWVLFRADTLQDAALYLNDMFSFSLWGSNTDREILELVMTPRFALVSLAALLLCTPLSGRLDRYLGKKAPLLRNLCLAALFLFAVAEMIAGNYNPFIYFRF